VLLTLKPEQTYSHKDSILVVDTWQLHINIVKKSQIKTEGCHDIDPGEHHDSKHVKNVKYSYFSCIPILQSKGQVNNFCRIFQTPQNHALKNIFFLFQHKMIKIFLNAKLVYPHCVI